MTNDIADDVAQAAERTRLSWRRMVLSTLVVVLLGASKIVLTAPPTVAAVAIWIMIVSWFTVAYVAGRRMAALRAGRQLPVSRSPALLALLVVALALLSAALLA